MILCCGEALIDFLPARTATGEDAYALACGGSIFNVAVGIGRLGLPAGLVGGVSTDAFGDMLARRLTASGVSLDHVARRDRPSALAFVTLGDDEPQYLFYDEGAADRMWTLADMPPVPDAVQALHFGSLSLLRDPAGRAYLDLMKAQADRVITLDPNLRPAHIVDEGDARARLGEAIGASDLVKVSAADLDWWAPGRPVEETARDWLTGRPSLVVVTKGGDGATAYRAGRDPVDRPIVAAPVFADAVGAGDAFMSGLLAGFARAGALTSAAWSEPDDETLIEAMDLAARTASVTVSRKGSNPPTAAELGLV